MNRDQTYLNHILDAIARINEYTSVGYDRFISQSHWQDAVIRQLETIGEATKRISVAVRDQYPEVPWRRIAGLRDVLIHDIWVLILTRSGKSLNKTSLNSRSIFKVS